MFAGMEGFPALNARASLKPWRKTVGNGVAQCFPALNARASLKPNKMIMNAGRMRMFSRA